MSVGKRLIEAMKQALAHAKGERDDLIVHNKKDNK